MREVFEVLQTVSESSSRNRKMELLAQGMSEDMKFVLATFLNPYLLYGVHGFDDGSIYRQDVPSIYEVKGLRDRLVHKEVTGYAARDAIREVVLCEDVFMRKWLVKMFKKDLSAGFSGGTVNKIVPGLIPQFQLGLCGGMDEEELSKLDWSNYVIEPKLDGLRCVNMLDGQGDSEFLSRNGKPLYNLGKIKDEVSLLGLTDTILDGEVMADNWNDSMTAVKSFGAIAPEMVDALKFYVFDCVLRSEWLQDTTLSLVDRKRCLGEAIKKVGCKQVVFVEGRQVTSWEEAKKCYASYLAEGYEGVVVKDLRASYPTGRSSAWLKWKPWFSADVEVTAVAAGSGRNKGRMGALVVEYKGKRVNVGSGFSDGERDSFWRTRASMLGQTIEVKYQEVTKDGSLRFPVFLRWRLDR